MGPYVFEIQYYFPFSNNHGSKPPQHANCTQLAMLTPTELGTCWTSWAHVLETLWQSKHGILELTFF